MDTPKEPTDFWDSASVKRSMGLAALGAIVVMVIWGVVVIMWHPEGATSPTVASFGDAFSPIIGLLSAFTFAAAIVSVFMQRAELELQRKEMADARGEFAAQAEAQRDLCQAQRQANVIAVNSQRWALLRLSMDVDDIGTKICSHSSTDSGFASARTTWFRLLAGMSTIEVIPEARQLALQHAIRDKSSIIREKNRLDLLSKDLELEDKVEMSASIGQ